MEGVVAHKGPRYWTLRTSELYAGKDFKLDWASFLPPGVGTRHQRTTFIAASKAVMTAMIESPRLRCGPGMLEHTTLLNWFVQLRRLVRWMTARGVWRFSQLTPDDVTAYLQSLKPRQRGEDAIASQSLRRHIYLLQCLWDFRSVLSDTLTFSVRHFESDLFAAMRLRQALPWRPISEADALRLLLAAKRWTDAHAVYVGELLERLWGEHRGVVAMTRGDAKRRRKAFYKGLTQEPAFQRLTQDLDMAGRTPYRILRAGATVLEGAILTSILLLVGLRARELVRLEADCVMCAEDGDPDNLLLTGVAAKKGGRRRTWAITGAVKDAVDAMRLMLAAPRRVSGQTGLVLSNVANTCALFPGSRLPERAQPQIVTYKMRRFAETAFAGEAALVRSVHAHAARKTFARFVVMRDKRVLESLAHHFGHTHRAITDGYYVGADMELAQLLDAENRQDLAQSLADLLSSRNIAGKAGKAFMSRRARVGGMRGKVTLQSVVDRLIADGVQLAPCDWGYCVYSKALSACQGDAKGPNEALRTAEICNGCANFVVTERHRAWWEERIVRDQHFLKNEGLPAQTVMVVQRRLTRGIELLSDLNARRASAIESVEQENVK